MYFIRKRRIILTLAAALLFAGCGSPADTGTAPEAQKAAEPREVSSVFRGFSEDIEWTESGVIFEDGPVTFQDPVTEEMLRNMIGKPEGEVLRSELQDIHAIHWVLDQYWSNLQYETREGIGQGEKFKGSQPSSLADFALCDNLQELSFGAIEVPSFAPLASLTQLEELYFGGSTVTAERLDELALLPALKTLELAPGDYMDWSGVTDGSFLLALSDRLTTLYAMGNVSWNPEVLSQMTSLKRLLIENSDTISFLEDLPQLERLSLSICPVSDWSPLASQQNLEYLVIGGNQYMTPTVTLEDLLPLKNLDYLALTMTDIPNQHSRQEIIDALPSLTGLYIF